MESTKLKINNIGCDGCVTSITNELTGLAGVQHVTGSVADKTVVVEYDAPATLTGIIDALKSIDYPGEPVNA